MDWIAQSIGSWGLVVVVGLMLSNGLLSFPPSEVILGLAGAILVSTHGFIPVISSAVFANAIGATIWYIIGWRYGASAAHRYATWLDGGTLPKKYLPSYRTVNASGRWLQTRGSWLIFAARCFPLVRCIISLPAGVARVNPIRYTLSTLGGMAIWATFWTWAGWFLRQEVMAKEYALAVPFILFLIISSWLSSRSLKKFLLRADGTTSEDDS